MCTEYVTSGPHYWLLTACGIQTPHQKLELKIENINISKYTSQLKQNKYV